MQHVRLHQKGGASVRKYREYNEREGWGRIPFPRRVAYLLLTCCYISIMAGVQRFVLLLQSLFWYNGRRISKHGTSLIDSVSTPRTTYTPISFYKLLIPAVHYLHFSYNLPHFSAAEAGNTSNFDISE